MTSSNRASSTQSDKVQAHENQFIKRSKDIYENFKFVKVARKEYRGFVSKVKYGGDFFSKS